MNMQGSNTTSALAPVQSTVVPQTTPLGQQPGGATGLGVLVLPHGTEVHILPSQQPQANFILFPQIPAEAFMIPAGLVNIKIQPRETDSQDEALIFNKLKIYTDSEDDNSPKKRFSGESGKKKTNALLILLMSIVSASLARQQLIVWSKIRQKKRARKTDSPYSISILKELLK